MAPKSTQSDAATKPQRAPTISLFEERSGQAVQLDFLQSIVILFLAFSVFAAAEIVLLNNAISDLPADETAAKRGANALAEDHLVSNPGDTILDRQCTENFFAENTGICGFPTHWNNGNYLAQATGITTRTVNATVYDANGDIATIDGIELALGPTVPENQDTNEWRRRRAGDLDGDSTNEWATVTFTVWG